MQVHVRRDLHEKFAECKMRNEESRRKSDETRERNNVDRIEAHRNQAALIEVFLFP